MASFLRHIGKHGDRKVAIIFREVPGEEHMALVVYSDVLPRLIHDELMKAVEGDVGQNSKEISEVLHRTYMADGRILLGTLHREGMIKKVPANQVLVNGATGTATSSNITLTLPQSIGTASSPSFAQITLKF